jgi:polyisoprenoid-binding protein YceI
MSFRLLFRSAPIVLLIASAAPSVPTSAQGRAPLAVDTARVTLTGASNVHAWTASTSTVRVTQVKVATGVQSASFFDAIVKPGALEAFEIAVPALSVKSDKDGMDKNMYKALKAQEHADITFRLARLEPGAAGALKAIGVLRIAGVEKEITLDLRTERRDGTLVVRGALALLMTDYGIKPPTAMLGMLKTDPKVTITFETVLAVPLT